MRTAQASRGSRGEAACRTRGVTILSARCASLDGVEDEGERAPRLAAVLRAEADEYDAAFAESCFDDRGAAREVLRAEEPARTQNVLLTLGVARDHLGALRVRHLEGGAVDEVCVGQVRESARERVRGVNFDAEDGAGAVEVGRLQTFEDVSDGQAEALDGKLG